MSSLETQALSKVKVLTNVLVGHDVSSMSLASDESCEYCLVKEVDVGNENLGFPYDSNQLSETRGFLIVSPKFVSTPFVSFSSTTMAVKTHGNLTAHSGCNLAAEMNEKMVLAPYLIRQSLGNLIEPELHAPPYAFLVPDIYRSIFEHSPYLRNAATLVSNRSQLSLPFCSSFICSKKIYSKFHDFIVQLVDQLWDANEFQFQWFENWKTSFSGRETGLLLERATALWFALNAEIEVIGNGFGGGYSTNLLPSRPEKSIHRTLTHMVESKSVDSEVYN
jgi:hypothetical protein